MSRREFTGLTGDPFASPGYPGSRKIGTLVDDSLALEGRMTRVAAWGHNLVSPFTAYQNIATVTDSEGTLFEVPVVYEEGIGTLAAGPTYEDCFSVYLLCYFYNISGRRDSIEAMFRTKEIHPTTGAVLNTSSTFSGEYDACPWEMVVPLNWVRYGSHSNAHEGRLAPGETSWLYVVKLEDEFVCDFDRFPDDVSYLRVCGWTGASREYIACLGALVMGREH